MHLKIAEVLKGPYFDTIEDIGAESRAVLNILKTRLLRCI
jgi:hypothetical protein